MIWDTLHLCLYYLDLRSTKYRNNSFNNSIHLFFSTTSKIPQQQLLSKNFLGNVCLRE